MRLEIDKGLTPRAVGRFLGFQEMSSPMSVMAELLAFVTMLLSRTGEHFGNLKFIAPASL